MPSSKEQQGEIRKPSSVINAKKERKIKEYKTLEISSTKSEITKRTFHAKMGTIKDRNSKDLKEAEKIKKRWQEYTEELYEKKVLMTQINSGVATHLELDIIECEVKWALGSTTTNKASGGDGSPADLFQVLKDGAMEVLHSVCQQIWKT